MRICACTEIFAQTWECGQRAQDHRTGFCHDSGSKLQFPNPRAFDRYRKWSSSLPGVCGPFLAPFRDLTYTTRSAEGNKNNADVPLSFTEYLGEDFGKLKNSFKQWASMGVKESDYEVSRQDDPAHFGLATISAEGEATSTSQTVPTTFLTMEDAKNRGWYLPISNAGKEYARQNKKRIPEGNAQCFLYAMRLITMGRLKSPIDPSKTYTPEVSSTYESQV